MMTQPARPSLSIYVLTALTLLFMLSACNPSNQEKKMEPKTTNQIALIKTAHGEIEFEFYPEKAPQTVARIQELIQSGFYDGLSFHRVVPGFVVQGGDPSGTGAGGSGQKIPAEFSDLKHVEGTVAMARSADPNSADSQFYIALDAAPHLDGSYTVFGKVIKGMEFVKKIAQGDKMITVSLKPAPPEQ